MPREFRGLGSAFDEEYELVPGLNFGGCACCREAEPYTDAGFQEALISLHDRMKQLRKAYWDWKGKAL